MLNIAFYPEDLKNAIEGNEFSKKKLVLKNQKHGYEFSIKAYAYNYKLEFENDPDLLWD